MVSDDSNDEIPMAECGSCRAVIPLDSKECLECGISFSGVSNESLGECGACKALVPIDSKSCPKCGVYFVADDVVDVLRQWLNNTGIDVNILFSKMDVDGDGRIDSSELKDSLLKLNLADLPPSQVDRLVSQFDANSDGYISLDELIFTITGEERVKESEVAEETSKPKEFSENVLVRVMEKHSITDRDAFLLHAENYDANENGYLTEGELKKAAEEFSVSDSNEEITVTTGEEVVAETESDEPVSTDDDDNASSDEESVEEVTDDDTDLDDAEPASDSQDDVSDVEETVISIAEEEADSVEDEIEETSQDSPLYKLALVAAENDMTIRDIFETMDKDDDGMIDGPELQNGIQEISGDRLSPNEVFEIIKGMDEDSDGRVDPMELVKAIELLDVEIESDSVHSKDPIQVLIDAMDEAGSVPASVFRQLDENNDGSVQAEELKEHLKEIIGDVLSEDEINHAFKRLDKDNDGSVDLFEFIEKLEQYDDEQDDGARLSTKTEFPSKMQKRMMSKKWNDVVWPLIHTGLFIFVVLWLVNATLAPFVDGSGGSIELDSETGMFVDGDITYTQGDIYPCDDSIQIDGCKNSFTPLAGESGATSMPAGFYWDGVLFIILGTLGFISSLFLHLSIVPGWRARAKAIKDSEEERKEVEEEITDSDDENEPTEEETEIDDADEEPVDNATTDVDDEQETDEDYEDDEIDIGSHIGLVLEDEEVFGVIIEFDDDENLVTIEEDGTGDLVTGYQDDMFIED